MKKLFTIIIALFFTQPYFACAGDGYYYTYSLFTQELIASPRYTPFLLEYNAPYYTSLYTKADKNENIEEWQEYLGIRYEDAYYLVMKAPREDIQNLIKGNKVVNDTLSFANPSLIKKHIQALKYISYSKYLEPYMVIQKSENRDSYWWYDQPEKTVSDLDYDKVINVLMKSWNAEADKELKIRYGYQLVRFAHYNRKYETAIDYFTRYVESLNYKPVMYYYTLNQKAGAERGLGNITQANYDFIKVFTHTKNLQQNVYNSIKLSSDYDLRQILSLAKSVEEQNDIYLLLGFQTFSNPLSTIEQIIKNNPDAVQAKVLMARAVKQISDAYILDYYPDNGDTDKRIPFLPKKNADNFYNFYYDEETLSRIPSYLEQAEKLAQRMAESQKVKDKDYWNITLTYLYFLEKDYVSAKKSLDKVKSQTELYINQKAKLQLLIEISEQPRITPEFEKHIYSTYREVFDARKYPTDLLNQYEYNDTFNFIVDILSNRYFIQGDYAKSFLLERQVKDILGLDFRLIDQIEEFYYKKNKNSFEQYIYEYSLPAYYSYEKEKTVRVEGFSFESYVAQVRAIQYFQKGDFKKALEYFRLAEKESYRNNDESLNYIYYQTSDSFFGYNKIECFKCKESEVIGIDYINEFPVIKKEMNFRETTEAILALQQEVLKRTEKGAKANYLLGNYFYNTSSLGYFRGCLLNYSADTGSYLKGKVYFKYSYGVDNERFNSYDISYPWDKFGFSDPYFTKALDLTRDQELKARILFALSKTEQGKYYQDLAKESSGYRSYYDNQGDYILIKDRKYFKELAKLSGTSFYKEVQTNCKYFTYYVTNYANK